MYSIFYDNLKNVKIIEHKEKQSTAGFSSWFYGDEAKPEPKKDETWIAIYNSQFEKWIITNDIHKNGLKSDVEDLEIVGFADNIDAIMFVIWEHQVSMGLDNTILDEIKMRKPKEEVNKLIIDDTEWKNWNSDKTISVKTNGGTVFNFDSKLLPNSHKWTVNFDSPKFESHENDELW